MELISGTVWAKVYALMPEGPPLAPGTLSHAPETKSSLDAHPAPDPRGSIRSETSYGIGGTPGM
jgi:hypothetical protein